MSVVPQSYRCDNCGHEFLFSPHDPHPAPVSSTGAPTCPLCWDAYLKTVGVGQLKPYLASESVNQSNGNINQAMDVAGSLVEAPPVVFSARAQSIADAKRTLNDKLCLYDRRHYEALLTRLLRELER